MRLLLLFLLTLCCHSGAAARGFFQALCEDKMKPTVASVTTRQNGYSIDNTVSLHELPAKSHKHPPAGNFVLGLTMTRYDVQISSRTSTVRNPVSHYECTSADITVKMSYDPTVIFVGREFRPGTCAYREILAHEMRHLNTYFEQLPKVEIAVRAALDRRFPGKAVYAPQGEGTAALQREVQEVWGPYFEAQMKKADQAHDAIDTPQEYARLSRVCQGEVQSFIAPVASTSP